MIFSTKLEGIGTFRSNRSIFAISVFNVTHVRYKWLEMYTFFVNLNGKCISSQTTYTFLIIFLWVDRSRCALSTQYRLSVEKLALKRVNRFPVFSWYRFLNLYLIHGAIKLGAELKKFYFLKSVQKKEFKMLNEIFSLIYLTFNHGKLTRLVLSTVTVCEIMFNMKKSFRCICKKKIYVIKIVAFEF